MHAHRQLLRQQLVELDAPPGCVAALFQRGRRDVRRRVVQQAQAVAEWSEVQSLQQRWRQRVGERDGVQRIHDELAQDGLRQSGGGRVDRGQALLQRRFVVHSAALRMHHLQPEITHAHFADGAYLFAHGELLLLAGIEVQEAQRQLFITFLHAADQAAARTEHHLAMRDDALHLHCHSRLCSGDGREMRLVLVAQRQMQQQIGAVMDAELGELAQRGGRDFGGLT